MRFGDKDYEYWGFLTREEWQLLFAVTACREITDMLPVQSPTHSYPNLIRELTQRHDFKFQNLYVDDDNDLRSWNDDPVCPENMLFFKMITQNMPLDYLTHIPAALTFSERHKELEVVRDVLRQGLAKFEEMNRQHSDMFKQLPKDQLKDFEELFESAHKDVTGKVLH